MSTKYYRPLSDLSSKTNTNIGNSGKLDDDDKNISKSSGFKTF